MKKSLFVLSLVSLLFVADVHPQRVKTTNPGVRAHFVYCAPGNTVGCESGNRVRMDVDAPYVDGESGVSAVFNVASGSQDLTINLQVSQRAVTLDLSDPYMWYNDVGEYVVPSWYATPQSVKPTFNVLKAHDAKLTCADPFAGCNFRTAMNAGGWKTSGDSAEYAMQWNPESTFRAVVNEQGPTSYVNVFYQKDGTGDVYTITPIPNASGGPVSGVAKTVRRTTTNAGQYFMPYTLVVRPK